MKTSIELLEETKLKAGLKTDTALAKWLGVPRHVLGNYRRDVGFMSEQTAKRIAAALELDHMYVMACNQVERAKNPELRKVWEEIAKEKAPAPPALASNGHATDPLLPHAAATCAACALGVLYYVKLSISAM